MAKRGTSKGKSVDHENHVAYEYGGSRSRSSGASATDKGDVRAPGQLFECKYVGKRGDKYPRSASIPLIDLEKLADEAWHEHLEPVYAIRLWNPESPLANDKGYVELTVRLMTDDVYRNDLLKDNYVS